MDPLTPSKRRGLVTPHDDTEVAVTPAPWDPAAESTGLDAPITAPQPVVVADDGMLHPGMTIGEYRVEKQIGEGGMGMVYAAVHPLIGKRAAVKVLRKELCRDAFQLQRFVDEARVVNQIGHPNIVDVFAFGETTDGRSYFVMEWLKGETLRARIARSRPSFDDVFAIIKPLARALEAAHEQGVIHRDLKPDNVFLVDVRGEAPNVKLLDFGIAKLAHAEHRVERTATGAMVGTPQYIAPEQAKGYAIDHRVDIYALGGILFELLTGRPPFVADNAMEMVAKHLMEAPPLPSSLAPVAPELDDLVVRMLAKDPAQRPTLDVVCRTLDRLKMHTPLPFASATVTAPDGPPVRLASTPGFHLPVASAQTQPAGASTRPAPRARAPKALLIGAALLIGGGAFAVARFTGGGGERDSATTPVPAATPMPAATMPAPIADDPPAPAATAPTPTAAAPLTPPTPVTATPPEEATPVHAPPPVHPAPTPPHDETHVRTTQPPVRATPPPTVKHEPKRKVPPKRQPPAKPTVDDDKGLLDPGTLRRGGP